MKLPGLPEPETIDFAVTFQSKTHKVGMGKYEYQMRLDVKPGPPVSVLLRANVTVPDLKLSDTTLAFSDVLVGQSRTLTVLLHNPKEVVAEWGVKKPIEVAKDFDNFVCEPDSGTLAPGTLAPTLTQPQP